MSLLATQQIDQAVVEVFAIMLGLACTPASSCLLRPEDRMAAAVTFSGCVRGVCIIGLPRQTASVLTELLLGVVPQLLPAEEQRVLLDDTVGELCNMIAGGWKSRLKERDAGCTLAPPRLLEAGAPQQTQDLTPAADTLYRCYQLPDACFDVQLTLET